MTYKKMKLKNKIVKTYFIYLYSWLYFPSI